MREEPVKERLELGLDPTDASNNTWGTWCVRR